MVAWTAWPLPSPSTTASPILASVASPNSIAGRPRATERLYQPKAGFLIIGERMGRYDAAPLRRVSQTSSASVMKVADGQDEPVIPDDHAAPFPPGAQCRRSECVVWWRWSEPPRSTSMPRKRPWLAPEATSLMDWVGIQFSYGLPLPPQGLCRSFSSSHCGGRVANVRSRAISESLQLAHLARTSVGRFRAQRSGCIERNGLGMDMRLTAMQ